LANPLKFLAEKYHLHRSFPAYPKSSLDFDIRFVVYYRSNKAYTIIYSESSNVFIVRALLDVGLSVGLITV